MTTILRIDSGAAHDASVTRTLAKEVVAQLSDADTRVVVRDLTDAAPGVVTHHWMSATGGGVTETDLQKQALAESDELVDEMLAADILVIAAPIYNFSIPASLKLWIDQISRAGKTFTYTEAGPKGLVSGKRAVIVVASGGVPVDSPADFATPYLRHVLGFVGITDVKVVAAERTSFDVAEALKTARGHISALVA